MIRRKKKIFRIYFILFLILFFILFLLIINFNIYWKHDQLRFESKEMKMKMEEALDNKKKINEKIKEIESMEGRERVIIEKMDFKKEGEKVIEIID